MALATLAWIQLGTFFNGALAQSDVGRPVPLVPPLGAGQGLAVPAAEPAEPNAENKPGTSSVQINELGAIDPSSIGVLEIADGSFGIEMWNGIRRGLVEALLPLLQVPTTSPALRSLVRRLLLSTARVPPGDGGPISLIALRLERLAAAGDIDGVEALLKSVPPRVRERPITRIRVDNYLLGGNTGAACSEFQAAAAEDERESYWLKGMAFCRALAGDHTQAAFAAMLLRDNGEKEDSSFLALLKVLSGDRGAKVEGANPTTALHFTMLQAAKQKFTDVAPDGVLPAIYAALARAPGADLDVRLISAERAESVGALKPEAVAEIYRSVLFTPDELSDAPNSIKKLSPARASALLYQLVQVQESPLARAEALALSFKLARERSTFATSARVNLAPLRAIAPAVELAWFAVYAVPALYLGGEVDAARQWFSMVQRNSNAASPDAAIAVLKLLPAALVRDARLTEKWEGSAVAAWANALKEVYASAADQQAHASLFFTLLEANGLAVPAAVWEPLLTAPLTQAAAMPSAPLLAQLRAAADAKRAGPVVLFSLLAIGADGPKTADPRALAEVIRSLRQVGLAEDARALAFEAVFARNVIVW
ncbi:MAG: hypothetical protein EXQ91_06305 [Alphaproteobacteria bacterium]|nr:hypothetical protein [Alphaproteobacteria bacterium]